MAAPWILMAIVLIAIITVLIAMLIIRRKEKSLPTDYYTLYIMGIIWLPMGIIFESLIFSAIGMVFMIIGLKNKDKWKENHRTLKQLSPKDRKMAIWSVTIGVILLVFMVAWIFMQK